MKVIPTETIGFHAALLSLLLSGYLCHIDWMGWIAIAAFLAIALACYWVVLLSLRRPRRLVRWWHTQVADRSRARFSAGIVIQFLDTLHVLLFFIAVLLVIANLVFALEGRGGVTWLQAFSSTFEAASIKGLSTLTPKSGFTQLLLGSASLLGLVITALWVTIFMRAFDAVFQFRADESKP